MGSTVTGLRRALPTTQVWSDGRLVTAAAVTAVGLAAWGVAALVLPRGLPAGTVLLGVITGALTSLTAVGLVLVYRSARIINFAQTGFGTVGTTLAILLVTRRHFSYFVAVPLGLLVALIVGALTEVIVVRRFFKAPRLILTVATIGVAQVLGFASASLPNVIPVQITGGTISQQSSQALLGQGFHTPFRFHFTLAPVLFTGDALIAIIAIPLVIVGLVWFFNRTDSGIAILGAADSQERASLLGIPVRRLSLVTWAVAAGLSAVALLFTAGVRGYTVNDISGPSVLLPALAAAVIAGFESFPLAVAASVGIGVITEAIFWSYPNAPAVDALLFGLILVALLFRRRTTARVAGEELGGFVAAREVRRVPEVVRRLPEYRRAVLGGAASLGFVALVVPQLLSNSQDVILTFTAIYGIIGISLVVLSGWGGQLTLGQFAFVGVGAGTAGGLLVYAHADYLLSLAAAVAVGAIGALIIGLPALRIPGLFLAPVTLAFAVAAASYLMNSSEFPKLNPARVLRPYLLDRINLSSPKSFYYFCLIMLVLAVAVARNFRRSRTGRAVLAVRENDRMASAFSISPTRMKLVTFALSGGLAGLAGGLYVLAIGGVPFQGFTAPLSEQVFAMAVVGGLTSVSGGILGAVYVYAAQYFLSGPLVALVTGAGILVVLMFVPGGIANVITSVRDAWLRQALRRRGLVVPSLDEGQARSVPRYLAGVGPVDIEGLMAGGPDWVRVWRRLGHPAQRRIRRFVDWGLAVSPPEYAAIAVGRARWVRRFQNRRLFPLLPVIPLLQAVNFAWTGMLLTSGASFTSELRHQFVHPWFWVNVAVVCGVLPIGRRVASHRAERLNLGLVQSLQGHVGPSLEQSGPHAAGLALEVRNLDAGYDHLQVLFGTDVEVPSGRIVALLGTNGAGKSTVLRVAAGTLLPWGGEVRFEGEDLTWSDPTERVRKGLVMVPSKGVFKSLSVRDNLRLGSWLARRDGERELIDRTMQRVFELFPVLEERLDQPAGLLSGGEQQMLAIALGILCRPKLLMIDELSLGLSPLAVASILSVVEDLNRSGLSVLIVEQSINVSATVAQDARFMEKGQVRFSGPTEELTQTNLLRSIFVTSKARAGRERTKGRSPRPADRPSPERQPVLSLTGVEKRFGGLKVLSGLELQIEPGVILGIIGPNGAGKTTAFDVCSGFVRPDAGHVMLAGIDVTRRTSAYRAALGLGRTFQDGRMVPALTATECLAMAMERWIEVRDPVANMLNISASAESEASVTSTVAQLLEAFGLTGYKDHYVGELSTGTRRVLDMACAVAHRPDVLLLDEPTSALAQREAEAMAQVILDVRERLRASFVIIEHDVPLVSSISDELVCMSLGAVVSTGPPSQVLADPIVIDSYLGTDDTVIRRSGEASERHGENGAYPASATLSPAEYAGLRGVSVSTVRRHIGAGTIKAARNGERWRIPASELERDLTLSPAAVRSRE